MQPALDEEATATDLSLRSWARIQAGRRDKTGAWARWYLDERRSPNAEAPPGYSKALAEYEAFAQKQLRRPAVQQAAERLWKQAIEGREKPHVPIASDLAIVPVAAFLEVRYLLEELVELVGISEGRRVQLRRRLQTIDQQIARAAGEPERL